MGLICSVLRMCEYSSAKVTENNLTQRFVQLEFIFTISQTKCKAAEV